ncbi:DNA-binding response regulator [Thioalkalivibrio denitrificans]|uniref:DNA-binding response regulator n=1 Tax=Thioalkalivibrio denitrificans TaxID=108003 RepID=A0A1V3NR28_9GAMM|nr:response regulator transcription factor [Thioalkalivibrio denitrificans]OOG27565.1 DNA-binding response regulator [Thioalkalivibrio denitrificans]
MSISVLVADDHAVVSDGLRLLLESNPMLHVAGQARDGREAIRLAGELQPDIVVMDISMPDLNGIEATIKIRERLENTRVIMLSMHPNVEYVVRALQAGARGYVLKASAGTELIDAILAVHQGRRYLSRRISEEVVDEHLLARDTVQPVDRLSVREREVLQLLAEGGTVASIATTLSISPKTVETYRARIMQKLHIGDLQGLVRFAIRHGMTSVG